MPSCWQCDNPIWSHWAFLSRFHACCRSPFRLHNRQSWLLGGSPVESLQSHFILTMSHWSSGLPVCFPSQGTRVKIPWGVLMWNRDFPVSVVPLQAVIYLVSTDRLSLFAWICTNVKFQSNPPKYSIYCSYFDLVTATVLLLQATLRLTIAAFQLLLSAPQCSGSCSRYKRITSCCCVFFIIEKLVDWSFYHWRIERHLPPSYYSESYFTPATTGTWTEQYV